MGLTNPFKAMIAKGIDAGADGARRAAKISNRSDRPVHYEYEFEVSGIAQVEKETNSGISLTLKPVVPELVGSVTSGSATGGLADGTFTYKMRVEFGLFQIADDQAEEPDGGGD